MYFRKTEKRWSARLGIVEKGYIILVWGPAVIMRLESLVLKDWVQSKDRDWLMD